MFDLIRTKYCIRMFKECQALTGDVAECGVGFGQTTFILDRFVELTDKKLYAFDTFKGLPYDDAIDSTYKCLQGEMADYGEQFFDILSELNKTSILTVPGLIEDTLYNYHDHKFCFVWLDMDLYQATSFAYKFFEDRMVDNGIIGFHDYDFVRCPGIKKVVDEEVDFDKYEKILNEDTCYFMRKKA